MGDKRNLVVIGNGMAGARTVEEILARDGGDLFRIAMFGAEPGGNYNRILLSSILDGTQSEEGGEPGQRRGESTCRSDVRRLSNPTGWSSRKWTRPHR